MNYLRQVKILIGKEIRCELRGKEILGTMLVFTLLVVSAFGFALDLSKNLTGPVLPGIIWITLTFAGILGLNRSFGSEKLNDTLLGLMLCPLDRSAIYVAKTLANILFILIVELVTIPLFLVIFNYSGPLHLGLLVPAVVLGAYCFMTIGTFLSTLTATTKAGEILLPVLLIPLILPVLLSGVMITRGSFDLGVIGVSFYLKMLVAYGVIFTVLPLLLFDYLLEV